MGILIWWSHAQPCNGDIGFKNYWDKLLKDPLISYQYAIVSFIAICKLMYALSGNKGDSANKREFIPLNVFILLFWFTWQNNFSEIFFKWSHVWINFSRFFHVSDFSSIINIKLEHVAHFFSHWKSEFLVNGDRNSHIFCLLSSHFKKSLKLHEHAFLTFFVCCGNLFTSKAITCESIKFSESFLWIVKNPGNDSTKVAACVD